MSQRTRDERAATTGPDRAPDHRADRVVARPNTTFKPRRRALSAARRRDLDRWLTRWGLAEDGPPIDWTEIFGDMPVVLDIGFGHGESTIEMARARPDEAIVGIEVHTPGVAVVLDAVEHEPLPHVRVVHGDALRFLTRVAHESLAGVRIFFPDPWPKPRHHQRRLVRDDVVGALVDRLVVGGELHLATDIAHYADTMRRACDDEPRLEGGIVERPASRPMTRFEQRALDEQRTPVDLRYIRVR